MRRIESRGALNIENRLLFNDPVEAQPFGPAFPRIWDMYRDNKAVDPQKSARHII